MHAWSLHHITRANMLWTRRDSSYNMPLSVCQMVHHQRSSLWPSQSMHTHPYGTSVVVHCPCSRPCMYPVLICTVLSNAPISFGHTVLKNASPKPEARSSPAKSCTLAKAGQGFLRPEPPPQPTPYRRTAHAGGAAVRARVMSVSCSDTCTQTD